MSLKAVLLRTGTKSHFESQLKASKTAPDFKPMKQVGKKYTDVMECYIS